MTTPENLRYTAEHEWVKPAASGTVRVGLTDFAQRQLGDIVFVELPKVGDTFEASEPFGSVESVKSVSEVYAPVSGTVVARNEQLLNDPELINNDPYGEGWLIDLGKVASGAVDDLLDAASYTDLVTPEDT
jgi:glycine cleavage system H protein